MESNIYTEGQYMQENPDWHIEDSPWKANHINKILDKNNINYTTLCEVGCGAGEILKQLEQKKPSVQYIGYEISPQAFTLTESRQKKNIKFLLSDLLDANNQEHYDVVMAIDVFEHVEDCFTFLRRLQKKATYKVFHIPLDLSVQGLSRPASILHARSTVGHIHFYNKELALALLKDLGYDIIDAYFTDRALELPSSKHFRTRLTNILRYSVQSIFGKDTAAKFLGGYSLIVLAK